MAKPGRPPIDPTDRSIPVTFSLPSRQLKAAEAQADAYRLTVQQWLRQLVKQHAAEITQKK